MINPWFRSYLVLTLLGLDIAEGALRFWQSTHVSADGADQPGRGDPWLSTVEPNRARWGRSAMVYNCAAAAYAHSATDLSRLPAVNDGTWREGTRRRAR